MPLLAQTEEASMKQEWITLVGEQNMLILRANQRAQEPVQGSAAEIDHNPVVRLHVPFTACQWLLSEVDEDGIAFCLADLGMGCPELGSVSLEELATLDVRGLRVKRDDQWRARMTLGQNARLASSKGQIEP
jgi:hypothetical protein